MAVRTMIMRTRAALGREALATLAAVEVSLERELDWREEGLIIYLHDGHAVCTSQMDVVQLGDEDRGHGDKQGGAVHVDSGSDGHHELPNALVNPGSVQALESDRQSGGPGFCMMFRYKSLFSWLTNTYVDAVAKAVIQACNLRRTFISLEDIEKERDNLHRGPEPEGVLANKDDVDDLEDNELEEEDAETGGDEEPCQLGRHNTEVFNLEDLGSDDAGDTNWRDPHDGPHHLHHGIIHNGEKVNHTTGFRSHLAQSDSKEKTKEDDSQHVG